MRLRTTLHLASFFPILIATLFIAYLLTVHVTVVMPGDGRTDVPLTGAIAMAIFSLVVGWCFYRAGQKLVVQVGVLEQMSERVKRGDLDAKSVLPEGRGEMAAVTKVFGEMVVELRGYIELIGAHDKLKKECDAALATVGRLRTTSVHMSGALELLRRAEQGIIARLLDEDLFLLSWLPGGALSWASGAPVALPIPSDVGETLRRLAADRAGSVGAQGDGAAGDVRQPTPVSVVDALQDAVRLCRWKWQRDRPNAPVAVEIQANGSEPSDVLAGRMDLVQAFAAVLINAGEAMPDGGSVAIEVRVDSGGTRTLSITDSGPGMSEAVRSRCMKPFFSTKEGRLGIGLNLAARLTTRCGGRLGVIGEPGHGTTVYMTFPRPRRPGEQGGTGRKPRGPLRILLVDDDAAARETLRFMLAKQGHRAVGVDDGAAAILLLRKEHFDVVMTDLAMPIMSGGELAAAVKARDPGIAVVLVSGAGEELERRNALPEGVDAILPKPVLSVDLGLALSRAMERVTAEAAPGADATA